MNLPNYFMVDLPEDATLSTEMILDACGTLKRNRDRYLAPRSTSQMVRLLAELADNWTQPDFPFRRLLLDQSPRLTGFSTQSMAAGLDLIFRNITVDSLTSLLRQELGHEARLDELRGSDETTSKLAIAIPPILQVHFTAGNLPAPGFISVLLGLLLKSAQFVKAPSHSSLPLRLLAHSIYDIDPKLGACLEVACWRGGAPPWESELLSQADCITVTGSDDTIQAVRQKTPPNKRFVAYGQRVSFGFLTRDAMSGYKVKRWAENAASDVASWDQQGCLSPHVFYVQDGGETTPERFAELLAAELAKKELTEPRAPLPTHEAAAIATRRSFYEVRASHANHTRQWKSENSTSWTVVYEHDPQFQLSCLNRFIYVKPVADLDQLLAHAEVIREKVSTVGLAAVDDEARILARSLARWGVSRVCRLGKMQNPPLSWRHDGRPVLGDLIAWCDWEHAY